MTEVLCHDITRRVALRLDTLPWILKVYRYPFDRWATVGRQGLFGAHNFLLYYLYRKFWPLKISGTFFYTINGQQKRIRFNPKNSTFHILYFKMFSEGYEPQISALFDLLVPDKGVFYDVGSNWGWFSMLLASRPGFQGTIHTFEPFPSTYQDLTSVVEQGGVGNVVHCHNIAMMEQTGTASMYLPDHIHSGCATVTSETRLGGVSIKTSTLDLFSGPPPDVMKVDVEGNELSVFKGGSELIRKAKPTIVFENKRDRENVRSMMDPLLFLERAGYVFYHAAWLRTVDEKPCLIGDEFDPTPQAKETLALVPFHSAQRLLLHDAMNIVACHRDKVSELEKLFTRKTL